MTKRILNIGKQTLQYKQNAHVKLFANEPVLIGPLAIRTKAELDFPEFDPNTKDVPERGYPKNTHLVDYMTSAAEREIEKHDRLLVQGMYFMRTHDFEPLSQTIDRSKKEIEKKVCLNIYLCNRRIPYINALLMGLSSYSSKETEKDILKAEIHFLNTEKRKERLHFMAQNLFGERTCILHHDGRRCGCSCRLYDASR
mmetsp:Transcript_3409/g.5242  ORF Transcript_3409/g.5242 Transcript_3409/m.5242 type:complete len:198 (-) Transcript_3409:528-1121(-)